MVDVDKKISKYLETKRLALSLRKEVENLQNLIISLEETIDDENKNIRFLTEEIITSIKVETLVEKIAELLCINKDDINIKITVIGGTYAKTLKELYGYQRDDSKSLNSYLKITLKNGTNICTKDLRLFNDLNEIQADGYILLRHCSLEKGKFQKSNVVVSKNINDIICNFRLDALNIDAYNGTEKILPIAIRKCMEDEKAKTESKIKEKQLTKN